MMLGARTAAWAKAGGVAPTAKDYVQDGLLHLVDGIENVAYGVRDPSVGKIYDCVTGLLACDLAQVEDKGSWLKASTTIHSTEYYYDDDATITTVFTPKQYGWWLWDLGSMMAIDGYTGNQVEVGPHISGRLPIACYMSKYGGQALARITGTFAKGEPNSITLVWHGNTKSFDTYVGDAFVGSANCSDVWAEGMTRWKYVILLSLNYNENYKLVLHNGRCYSRALTADEIAHNYAIDKARFNLP